MMGLVGCGRTIGIAVPNLYAAKKADCVYQGEDSFSPPPRSPYQFFCNPFRRKPLTFWLASILWELQHSWSQPKQWKAVGGLSHKSSRPSHRRCVHAHMLACFLFVAAKPRAQNLIGWRKFVMFVGCAASHRTKNQRATPPPTIFLFYIVGIKAEVLHSTVSSTNNTARRIQSVTKDRRRQPSGTGDLARHDYGHGLPTKIYIQLLYGNLQIYRESQEGDATVDVHAGGSLSAYTI